MKKHTTLLDSLILMLAKFDEPVIKVFTQEMLNIRTEIHESLIEQHGPEMMEAKQLKTYLISFIPIKYIENKKFRFGLTQTNSVELDKNGLLKVEGVMLKEFL